MFGSQKIPVYCHMGNFGCGGGGWTLAMKTDGKKVSHSASFSQQSTEFFANRIDIYFWHLLQSTPLPTYTNLVLRAFSAVVPVQLIVFFVFISEDLSLWFGLVEQQKRLQPPRRKDWVWHWRDQATDVLEHVFLQDLPRYEDPSSANQVSGHQHAGPVSAFTDSWRQISLHITEPQHMEDADWSSSVLAGQL